jgi:FAD/FMN-containing dehydrogenase
MSETRYERRDEEESTRRPRKHKLRLGIVGVFLAAVLTVGGLTVQEYSAPPTEPKDCAVHAVVSPLAADAARPQSFPGRLTDRHGTVNDASCLNPTSVYGVAHPRSDSDVRRALSFARENGLSVAVAGTQHSMGGQSSFPGALVLDTGGMDRVQVNADSATVRVQAGATWRRVLEAVHPRGLSVAAMPSIDVLSVGGTISSNAHGADFRTGSLASTVRSLTVMRADGSVQVLTRHREPRLFRAVVGGYGLFGVILEAELDLVPSEVYDFDQRTVDTADFPALFASRIEPDSRQRLMYAHLSTAPGSLLEQAIVYTYRRTATAGERVPALRRAPDSRFARLVFNLARTGSLGQALKWRAQRDLLPRLRSCRRSRNEALRDGEACLVARNQAMYNGLGLLKNRLEQYTDILQEYFVPHDRLVPFIRDARAILTDHEAVLMNASIRVVHEDDIMLSYANGERFSLVFYLSQEVTDHGSRDMASLTRELVDAALRHGGTFYLPYQQHYTSQDLERAYPRIGEFFALKRRYDPDRLFVNHFYSRYAGV